VGSVGRQKSPIRPEDMIIRTLTQETVVNDHLKLGVVVGCAAKSRRWFAAKRGLSSQRALIDAQSFGLNEPSGTGSVSEV
jgi:hypothetical protein